MASAATRRLSSALPIELLFLPKQWPGLKPMDRLRRGANAGASANRQYGDIDE